MKKITLILGLLIIGFSISFTSCKKKVAPVLPATSSFIFPGMDNSQKTIDTKDVSNWFIAAADVTVWTSLIKLGLAIPIAAYEEALKQTPRHVSGDKWVWEYSFNFFISSYNVQLYGEFNPENGVDWEMYISKVGGFQDFLWFTGNQDAEGTTGSWILYKSPEVNHELLQIDWTKDLSNNTGTIKYTNIEPEAAENGGYISYGNGQTGDFDAFYDIFNKGLNNLTEIDYNTQFYNGRIKDFNIYSDDIWHCWDEQLLNNDCTITK